MNLAKISSFSQIVRPCFPILLFDFNLLILLMNVLERISNECIWRNLLAINLIYTNKCSLHVLSLLMAIGHHYQLRTYVHNVVRDFQLAQNHVKLADLIHYWGAKGLATVAYPTVSTITSYVKFVHP